jgi:general secretion pathway protein I
VGKASGGFTLLEVLVALAILSISLGALFPIFSGALRGQVGLDNEQRAIALAHAKLDALGSELPLTDGATDGTSPDGIKWHLVIAPYGSSAPGALLAAKLATLTVTWPARHGEQSLVVNTVRAVGHE